MGLLTRVTNAVWVWHGCRFGLVLKSTPTNQSSQLPQDDLPLVRVVYSRAERPVDLWGLRVVPGLLSGPPIPRRMAQSIAICRLYAVRGLINV